MTDTTLDERLRARYPTRADLKRFLKRKLDRNLDDYAAASADLVDTAFELKEAAEAEGWLDDLVSAMMSDSRPVTSELAARELLDLATFDMRPLEEAFIEVQLRAGNRRVIGVAVTMPDNKLVRYFCTRLQIVLGRVGTYVDSDGTTLNPDLASVDIALRRVLVQQEKLRVRNIVFPVWCDRAGLDAIGDFWARVRDQLEGATSYLVLVLITSLDSGLPHEVGVLPPPRVVEADLRGWTVKVANQLGWPVELALVWLRQLVAQATVDEEINVPIVYALMDRDVARVLGEQGALERELRELIEEAG